LAVLYNPIFRVHLDRSTWASVNWFTVGAIAVATAFFWPRDKESTVLSEDKVEILPISRQTVAREWLIFLAVLPLGFVASFFLGFYREEPSDLSRAYDDFWNAHLGLGSASSLALWLAPYLALTLIRSILWSISALWPGRSVKRETFHSVLALSLIAVVFLGVVVIQNRQHQATPTKRFDPDKYLAQTAPARVKSTDLKKITLFDVVVKSGPSDTSSDYTWLTGFDGRVRNDLSRAAQRIGLKASLYNPAGELIEVRTFWMLDPNWENLPPLLPSSPVTFHSRVAVDRLPVGWKYRLEVIEAHYAPDIFDSIQSRSDSGVTRKNRELTDQEVFGNQAAPSTPAAKSEYDVLLEPTPKQKE